MTIRLVTVLASSKHIELMVQYCEPVFLCHLLLEFFYEWMIEFENFTAFGTDHMVMMPVVYVLLVALLPLAKI